MKLPLDDRSSGIHTRVPPTAPGETADADKGRAAPVPHLLFNWIRQAWRRVWRVIEPGETCDIPDRLREDAGLLPREPERPGDWWSMR